MSYASIELINRWPHMDGGQLIVDDFEVRSMNVTMLADTGSYYLCINEHVMLGLHLNIVDSRRLVLANGEWGTFQMAGPIELRFGTRKCITDAIVLPGDSECLLGAIPMEAMNLTVNPVRQELVVNEGYE